jgi:hypothetical protein
MNSRIFLGVSASLNLGLILLVACLLTRSPEAASVVAAPAAAPWRAQPSAIASPGTFSKAAAIEPAAANLSASARVGEPIPNSTASAALSSPSSAPLASSPRPISQYQAAARFADESPASDTADESLGERQPVANPSAAGNVMRFRGVRVAMAETYQSTSGRSFGLDISPDSSDPSSSGNESPNNASATQNGSKAGTADVIDSSSTATTRRTASRNGSSAGSNASPVEANSVPNGSEVTPNDPNRIGDDGFPPDIEAFRQKWGWAAADAALSEGLKSGTGPRLN